MQSQPVFKYLHRVRACFTGTDTDDLLDILNKNLAVANLAGAGGLDDGIHGPLGETVIDHQFDFYLWQKIDDVFGAAVQLGMAFLAAKTLYFGHGQTGDTDFSQRFTYFVQFERFDNGSNLLHDNSFMLLTKIFSALTPETSR